MLYSRRIFSLSYFKINCTNILMNKTSTHQNICKKYIHFRRLIIKGSFVLLSLLHKHISRGSILLHRYSNILFVCIYRKLLRITGLCQKNIYIECSSYSANIRLKLRLREQRRKRSLVTLENGIECDNVYNFTLR